MRGARLAVGRGGVVMNRRGLLKLLSLVASLPGAIAALFRSAGASSAPLPTAAEAAAPSAPPTYRELLPRLRASFPSPFVAPEEDRVFYGQIDRGLAHLNRLKQGRLYLGTRTPIDYARARTKRIGEAMSTTEATVEGLASFLDGMIMWSHPDTHRLHGGATCASIIGQLYAALYDPNLVWDDLSERVAEAEVEVAAICADLVGFDAARAAGVFTFGGSGTELYGVKIGIEKAQPGAFRDGVKVPMRIFASDVAHYAKITAAAWLGLGANAVVPVRTDANSAMDLGALETALRAAIEKQERIACIVATLGTTDAFGLDDARAIVALRDRLAREYRLDYTPHVHADSVIGWAYSVFRDYDFAANSMAIPPDALADIAAINQRVSGLETVDSAGLDFHKSGYAPYMSSLFLCRDQKDLSLIARDKSEIPYLFQFGKYEPGIYTLECSRSGGPVLAALANLRLLGKEGYRALLAHSVAMSTLLRERARKAVHLAVASEGDHGCVVVLRPYPDGVNAAATFAAEVIDPAKRDDLLAGNEYVRKVYMETRKLADQGDGVVFVLTTEVRPSGYGTPIAGIKCFTYSAFTDEAAVDRALRCIARAREVVAQSA
jgi:glutamate/tyrosine decarboxylase-like PLP-dependent enzyme